MQQNLNMQQKINKKRKQLHIALSQENYNKLKSLGSMGSTFDDVLTKILSKEPGVYKIEME